MHDIACIKNLHLIKIFIHVTGVPRRIRYDAGTENTLIEDIQVSFRMDHSDDMAGPNSVIMGPSPSNQVKLDNEHSGSQDKSSYINAMMVFIS